MDKELLLALIDIVDQLDYKISTIESFLDGNYIQGIRYDMVGTDTHKIAEIRKKLKEME